MRLLPGVTAVVLLMVASGCAKKTEGPPCDQAAVTRRESWLDSPNRHRGDGKTHREIGFRATGNCSAGLEQTQLTCDAERLKGIVGDSPFLADALDAGFEVYVCKTVDGDKVVRREYPLALLATRPDAAQSVVDDAMATMTRFKDKLCKCTDAACATAVSDEMTKWSQDQSRNMREPPRMTEAQTKQAAAIGEEMGRCMRRAMGDGE